MPPEVTAMLQSSKPTITPSEAARVLSCAPYLLNVKAKSGSLPFPAFFVGNRLKIPRIPFLRYLGYIN